MTAHNARSTGFLDIHVGREIATRRKAMGFSQADLARFAGVSFQQIRKYENGENRISASRLYAIACALGIDLAVLFPAVSTATAHPFDPPPSAPSEVERAAVAADWARIRNGGDRRAAARVIRAMSAC